jgi:hypothetical protein
MTKTSTSILVFALLLSTWNPREGMNVAFAWVSPTEFSFAMTTSARSVRIASDFTSKRKKLSSHNLQVLSIRNELQKPRTMTGLFMTATTPVVSSTDKSRAVVDYSDEIVAFGGSAPPVKNTDKQILGGKGQGLQEMGSIGIAVPPGFTLTTRLCQMYQDTDDLACWDQVHSAIERLELDMGKTFGSSENPLLLSCRSGAAISMPGMMDTVLNM